MDAIVLVGGQGTRLRPLTYDMPKPMLPIVERPMVARIVEWLSRHEIKRVVFSLGYRPDAFLDAFPKGEWDGVKISYAVEPEALDTAGAIRFAALAANFSESAFAVVNGDILTDLDLRALVAFHLSSGATATIALTPVEDPSTYGVVPTDANGRVTAFIEKPPRETAPTNCINAGVYVLEPSVVGLIPAGRPVSIEREVFPDLVEDESLFGLVSNAYWIDTGTKESYLQAHRDILSGFRPDVALSGSFEASTVVHVAEGGRVEGGAISSYVGRNATVERGATVSESVIGAGSIVRAGASVRSSVLLQGVTIEESASVENSIVGPNSRVGRDACLRGAIIRSGRVVAEGEALSGSDGRD